MKSTKQTDDRLVEEGLITPEQLAKARSEALRAGGTVREAILRMRFVEPSRMADWLSQQLQIPRVELKSYVIDPKVLQLVPEQLARKHRVIPLFKVGDALTVATADPLNLIALDELHLKTAKTIEPVVATDQEINQALADYYGTKGRVDELVLGIPAEAAAELPSGGAAAQKASDPPVVQLVNLLLTDAARYRASDIHLEPEREGMRVRFRIDGILREQTVLPKSLEPAVVSRVKILSGMDIADQRKPQDGRFRMSLEGHEVDLRVSVMPSMDGETVVMRLLDTQGLRLDMGQLGMDAELLARYQRLVQRAWGILLVTGPTGSGKTTTLYSTLALLNAAERNIVTIEDPVEYRLPGIRQIQVNASVQLSFATGLRSILRQDPNIIMVGEIRDRETAEIAIQSALTGHMVFSTLHTNDAATAITRLLDMGIEPFLVSSSLVGVLAQRLVRSLCLECKTDDPAQEEKARKLGFTGNGRWMKAAGCRQCGKTGYRGRIGLFELMPMDETIQKMTLAKTSASDIAAHAHSAGMKALREDGLAKAAAGITTFDEVFRVVSEA